MIWHNSNRLLTVPGFSGIKTGINPHAGSCLSVHFEQGDIRLIAVILGSKDTDQRTRDGHRLCLWAAEVLKTQAK